MYRDLELDWGVSEVMHMLKYVKTGDSMYWIGNWIRSYHMCYFISIYIDMMATASLSIGIWNWIGVYLRSCLNSNMSKLGFPCIGLEIGLGQSYTLFHF